jgi:hypothetical protein
MKSRTLLATALLSVTSFYQCTSEHNQIGSPVDTQKAISVREAYNEQLKNGKFGEEVTVFGRVHDVCQAEGCWFAYEFADSSLVVDFDEQFTVPKNIGKKNLYATGHFYRDTAEIESADSTQSNRQSITVKFLAKGVRFK